MRSLPLEEWPRADREAWEQACRPSVRLIKGGAASHLKAITRADLARRVLGHKNIQTTINFYIGLETTQATRRFGEIVRGLARFSDLPEARP